jgi:hypothetical protein
MPDTKLKIILEGLVGAATVAATVVLAPLLRPWYRRWGATDAEVRRALPGDEYVPHPKSALDLAITIHAPVAQVWPWFVQLGCQRGGWYAYDLLDNGGLASADRILPEFQKLDVGDTVKAVPNGAFGFPVARIEAERVLVLGGTLDTGSGQSADPHGAPPQAYFSGDQTFFLEALDEHTTRLHFRMYTDWNQTTLNTVIYRGIVEPISFVMGRKMLRNVRRRAEALAKKVG